MQVFDADAYPNGVERDQLQAMVGVGSEYMTHMGEGSTVQRTGEFVRIDRRGSDPTPRFCLFYENPQVYDESGIPLSDGDVRQLPADVKLRRRTRMFVSEIDQGADLPFHEVGGKVASRIPRCIGVPSGNGATFESLYEGNYTTQAGKRRLFSIGDGRLLLVKEVVVPGDGRYFYGSKLDSDTAPYLKERSVRAARVELVELNPLTGAKGRVLLAFDVHSGLGVDADERLFSNEIRTGSTAMVDSSNVYAAFSGVLWGRSLSIPAVGEVPIGGDPSDTYAVAEPAFAEKPGGMYLALMAVYPAAGDTKAADDAGPRQLTCAYTTPDGDVGYSTITFQVPLSSKHYLAARGMSLHRLTPTKVVLRVLVHAMQNGSGGDMQPSTSSTLYFWSGDNGASWSYTPITSDLLNNIPYGGVLVQDKDTVLLFTDWRNGYTDAIEVWAATASGFSRRASIDRDVFNAGLMQTLRVPYFPVGMGGAVYLREGSDMRRRLWMQFEPYWVHPASSSFVLDYPGSRPQLLVSDDDGATWSRRFLPTPWQFRVGFVVSVDSTTLAVPVYAPRKDHSSRLKATVYLSHDGGDTWRASGSRVVLPGESLADGNIVEGAVVGSGASARPEQDIDDACCEFNRGELFPLVVLRDRLGALLPANPARPWMTDFRFKEPDYG